MLYLDSEGDPELHFRLGDHLAMCPQCVEWLARQGRFECALKARLAEGEETPGLWDRALKRADALPPAARRRRLVRVGLLAVAAALLLAVAAGLWFALRPPAHHAHDLPLVAVDWHERLLRGETRPDFESTSDQAVDRYLKEKVPFKVHCPPEADVDFAVQGAGVCPLKDRRLAAYIVGRVGGSPVSILVLDHSALGAFPLEGSYLKGGNRHKCSEGGYQMVSGVVADNVVVVVGAAPLEDLERLLNAYGSYPEG
jgi:anti-sigma factor RsiW